MKPAARFTLDDIEKEKKACKVWRRGARGERRSAANGIDWKDDAPGWWLVGLKRRERMAVGGKKRISWIPSAYEAMGEKDARGGEGVPIKS